MTTVTHVSERLLPMSPVCTNVTAWGNAPGERQSEI